jgi:dTDP-4-amino-4,6-dideoxygalactose transaminase
MSAQGVHRITEEFENVIRHYTGAKYCVALDNGSSALFLSLKYYGIEGKVVEVPKHTYPSVPCEIIHAGGKVKFVDREGQPFLKGAYFLTNTMVVDSALRFSADMYIPNTYMCLSFTGPHKHLKLGKGGAILTDDFEAYRWFKKARFSGRDECSYHEDNFDMKPSVCGWNFYMMPEIAARGLLLMAQFYNGDEKLTNPDKILSYPDLSKFKLWK